MNILVTGASGFIGTHIIKELVKGGHNVACTFLTGEKERIDLEDEKKFCLEDYRIDNFILFLKRNEVEGVIHLASYVQSGNHLISDIENLIDSNLKFGTFVLEAAVQSNVKWFINTGTYWQHYNNSNYSPVNLYAATKQAFEAIAKYYVDLSLISFNTIMLYDTYGTNDNRPKVFNLWEKIISTGIGLDMSPGDQIIDISYIDDIVDAYVQLANLLQIDSNEITNGSVFAVKALKRFSLKELAGIFEEVSGMKLNVNWGGRSYRDREIMDPWSEDQVVPGWKPKVSIEEGIGRILKQY